MTLSSTSPRAAKTSHGDLAALMARLYGRRFPGHELEAMQGVWHVLVRDFFQPRLDPGVVVDVGAGACLFINEVKASRRIALDANPSVLRHAAPGVEAIVTHDLSLVELGDGSANSVFLSNFLEHLPDYSAVLELLATINRKLCTGGRLLILQPNFGLVPHRYFDFIDHQVILTDRSLTEALEVTGFEIGELRRRFLPFTSKSVFPKWPWAVAVYLRLPPVQWLVAGQTFVCAVRRESLT